MKYLPGTTIEIDVNELGVSEKFFSNMFKMGGLVMSQLSNLLGLEPYIIQNWVKRGFVSPPVKKMYTKRQFCRLCIINMLKDTLRLDRIADLISYVNGKLDDESDDTVGDDSLYDYYVDLCFLLKKCKMDTEEALDKVVENYDEPCEGGRERLKKVLLVMHHARVSAVAKKRAESILENFDIERVNNDE